MARCSRRKFPARAPRLPLQDRRAAVTTSRSAWPARSKARAAEKPKRSFANNPARPAPQDNAGPGRKKMRIRLTMLGAAFLVVFVSSTAGADPVADFYKDKQISWILSANAGGGYASYAHAFAGIYSDHIPGKPKILVQNMPGAGGIKAMNYLMNVAPKDGTAIGLVHSSVSFAPLYGLEGATFDPRKMHWIGSLNTASAMCVAWHASGIKTWEDLLQKGFVVGTSGAGSQMETLPAMLNKLFNANIKIISGYKGGNEVFLAMERGEVHGRCGGLVNSIQSTRPEWFPEKKVYVPIQLSLERSERFPDVPTVGELAKD